MAKVTLVFEDERQKEEFLGQLSDGWGEQWVDLHWQGDLFEAVEVSVKRVYYPNEVYG